MHGYQIIDNFVMWVIVMEKTQLKSAYHFVIILVLVQVLSKLIKEFDHDIPNTRLNDMKTVDDAVKYFQTEVRETSAYEDLEGLDLPKNLSIMKEYHRFDPATDTFFQGRTAFPGRDTFVTSIKFQRKYKNISNREEKAGYADHYAGY